MTWTLVFYDDRQVEVFRADGETPTEAARSVRADNDYLAEFRCIAALPGSPEILTAPSHACVGEDVFE